MLATDTETDLEVMDLFAETEQNMLDMLRLQIEDAKAAAEESKN